MANINEEARIPVYINDEQAKSALKTLTSEAEKWRKKMFEAMEGGDLKGMKEAEKELKKLNSQMASIKKEAFDVNKVLSNISSASTKDLKKALAAVNREMDGLNRNSKEYQALMNKKLAINAEFSKINGVIREQPGFFSRAADSANKYFGIIAAAGAAFTGVVLGLKQVVQAANDYEERVSNLSALTGLTGDSLKWLSDQAKVLSTSTLEGGIRITQSAQDIVDAFTKMGSARPELLKNKEALLEVTKQALILAQASKIGMEPAIAAVAASMNQFNLDATQSSRIINVLGAGALEGSSEVGNLTDSLKNVGAVANDSNMSLEQTVAALEVLAEKQLKGEEAGTKLRGALLKMKEAGVGYASGQFNLRDAITEVNAKLAAQSGALEQDAIKQKIFGIENVTAGTVLLENVDKYDKLTAAVTGTNVATMQAITNTDNNNAKLAQAKNRINVISIELGEKLSPAMVVATGWFGKSLKVVSYLVDVVTKYSGVIITTTAAIIGYTAATKLVTIWETRRNAANILSIAQSKLKVFWNGAERAGLILLSATQALFTGNVQKATVAMRLFRIETGLNPIGLLVGFLVAVTAALLMYSRGLTAAQQAQKAVNYVNIDAQKNIVEEKLKVEQLLKVAKNEKLSKETRLKAIKDLNEISPEYLGNLTLENIKTDAAKKATDSYTESLLKNAKAQAAKEKLVEIEKQLIDLQNGEGADISIWQDAWNIVKSGGNSAAYAANQTVTALNNIDEKTKALMLTRKKLTEQLDNENNAPTPTLPVIPAGGGKKTINPLTPEEIKAATDIALQALDLAHASEILRIKQYYADKEQLDKESKARLLASELAYLKAKAQLEPDELKKIELQSQIIDKQQQYTAALKEAVPEILKTRDGIEKLNSRLLEESKLLGLASQKQKQGAEDQADYTAKQVQQADTIKMIGDVMTDYVTGALNGSMDEFQSFGDTLILMSLQILKQMVPIWSAQILGLSLASPESVATWGAAGMAKYALITGLMYAGIGVVEGMVKSGINKKREAAKGSKGYVSGGSTGPGGKYEVAGVVHAGEYVIPQEGTSAPGLIPFINLIEIARRNNSLARLDLRPVVQSISSGNNYVQGGEVGPGRNFPTYSYPIPGKSPENNIDSDTANRLADAVEKLMEWEPSMKVETYEKKREAWNKFNTGGFKRPG